MHPPELEAEWEAAARHHHHHMMMHRPPPPPMAHTARPPPLMHRHAHPHTAAAEEPWVEEVRTGVRVEVRYFLCLYFVCLCIEGGG